MFGLVMVFMGMIAYTHSSKPRSVNVALETILEFDNKDDIEFIDNMQKFLDKLKQTITKNRASEVRSGNDDMEVQDTVIVNQGIPDDSRFKFTDFLSNTVAVLKSYNDNDLKRFFRTLDREMDTRNRHNIVYDASDNFGFRRLVSDTLKDIKDTEAKEIRKALSVVSRKLNEKHKHTFLIDLLNSLYRWESKNKLTNFLNSLKFYGSNARRKELDLRRIIRSGIQAVILDPISRLSPETINGIKALYEKYWVKKEAIRKPILKFSENKLEESGGVSDTRELTIKMPKEKFDNSNKVTKENEILDYIEDHKRVIDKRVTTGRYATVKKAKAKKIKYITTATLERYIRTTPQKKLAKLKYHSVKRLKKKSKMQKKLTTKYNTDLSYDKQRFDDMLDTQDPVVIRIESGGSGGDEDIFRFTTKKRTVKPQRHTKPNTTKRRYSLKTTKKFRKAFRTTAASHEGLSIEHFGSLYNLNIHRKSNVNDSFTQNPQTDITIGTTEAIATVKDVQDAEIKRNDDLDRENEIYLSGKESNEASNATFPNNEEIPVQVTVKNIKDTEIVTKRKDLLVETTRAIPKLESNRKFILNAKSPISTTVNVKPTLTTEDFNSTNVAEESSIEATSTGDVYAMGGANSNATAVTDSVAVQAGGESKEITPIVLRSNDITDTDSIITKVPNATPTLTTTIPRTKVDDFATEDPKANDKPIDKDTVNKTDGLEDELENLMHKFNSSATMSTLPIEMHEFIKKSQAHTEDKIERRMREQMMADMEKLFAPTTTTTTTVATELFTDPFQDIDDALDLM